MTAQVARDYHQVRLLSRDAVRQLMDAALLSREAERTTFAIWLVALVATPTAFFAARQVLTYTGLVRAPEHVVQMVALQHRLFFVTYAMLAAALLAALAWEALFPDGRDQEIIGVLPVRPHVFAASRLTGALLVGLGFAAAVNIPAAILYSLFSAGHPLFGWNFFGLLAGHTLATMMASMLTFCVLLIVRGLVAVCFSAGAGKWAGAVLQLTTVVLMFEAFFFLPAILDRLSTAIVRGDVEAARLPPVWFAALHAWIIGHADQALEHAMLTGLAWSSAAMVLVIPTYLVPARWLGQRALEKRSRERAAATTFVVRTVSGLTRARPCVRGVFLFSVTSLVRSQRHLIVLATYFGMAVAVSIISILWIDERGSVKLDRPASWMLTLPMIFGFFGVVGLRACCRIPSEVEANWPFRIMQPTVATCVNATALFMFTLAVLPVAAATALVLLPHWHGTSVAAVVLLQVCSGGVLVEVLLLHWRKVPFASVHAPSPDVLKAWWPVYAVMMYLYAFVLANVQFVAATSLSTFTWYVTVCAVVVIVARLTRMRQLRHRELDLDGPPRGVIDGLNLSEALN